MAALDYDLDVIVPDDRWRGIIYNWQNKIHRCTNCRKEYLEIENIGQWKCMQHTSQWNTLENPGKYRAENRWDCCGKTIYRYRGPPNFGCIRCDHTDSPGPYTQTHNVPIPPSIIKIINPINESLVDSSKEYIMELTEDQLLSNVFIQRYDHQATIKQTYDNNQLKRHPSTALNRKPRVRL
jgi:hypothetical protein